MASFGNTIGILIPQPSAPAMVSQGSANPPEPLTNAAGPVDVIEMVADVASTALSLASPDSAVSAAVDVASTVISLASMIPGVPGPKPPTKKTVKGFSGGGGMGFNGGLVTQGKGKKSRGRKGRPAGGRGAGSGGCPCKGGGKGGAVGRPVNAILGIKVLPEETDFVFDSPLPLIWQRSYYSDQPGNGWLGQGWSLPFSMRLERTQDGFLYIDEQGREIPLPDIDDEQDEPQYADDEDDFDTEEADPVADPAEEDPYGLEDAYFDHEEQIYFSQVSDGLYQIASPDGGARLWFAEVDEGDGIYQLIAQLDRNHHHIRLCYGDNGLPHSVYDSSGRQFQLHFSSIRLNDSDEVFDAAAEYGVFVGKDDNLYVNRLTSVTFNNRELVRYGYDGYGDLTAVYGRDGKRLRGFAYRNHIMIEHNQPDGLVSRYEYDRYDTDGKVLNSHTNLGEAWTFDYREGYTRVTDALGREEIYGFDENYEEIYHIDAAGHRSDSERDDWGRIVLKRDELGRETRFGYDTFGNVISITAPDGSRTQIDYHDTLNLPVAVNDPAGRITEYAYDGRGNLIQVTDPAGHSTEYTYNEQWLPATITDALGKTKQLEYGSDGQLIRYIDCSGQATRFGYTEYGDLETVTDALGHTTRHHYDAAGNHIRSDYPDGSSESFEYDRINRLIAHIDGLGAKTEYELAVDGLPVKRTNALGHTFGYRYDQARRLTTLTNENGDSYRLDYDNTDNLIQETGWDGKITGYAYDAAGQLSEQTEYGLSDGPKADRPEIWHIHRFKRNILGQLVEKTSRRIDGAPVPAEEGKHYSRTRFDYDPLTGNLVKARNRHSSVELVYDVLDRLVSETTVHNGQSASVGYAYDPLGNRTQTVLPDGCSINYLYYGSGHLHQINLDGEVISDIERDRLHQEIQRTQGALTSRYDYDPMGRLKHQTATANRTFQHNGKLNTLVGGAVRRSYRYDQAGNLIQTADQRSGVLDYVYDKLGRIESAVNKQTGSSEKFAFDPAHNILSDKVSDGLKDTQGLSEHLSDRHHTGRLKGRNIGKGNRLEAYNGTEYTYDALGNMIYRQLHNGESQLFQYDSENQLIRAEIKKPKGNTEIWEYAYDPFGRRLSKERKDKLAWTSTAPKRTHFVWDGTRLLQEYNYKGSYTYVYTDQDSYEPLAQVFDNHKDRQQYLFYFHNNQIGTPHEMTDIHGNLLWYGSYSAWGSIASEKRIYENIHQPFRLQNQYFDAETGLHYNFFRYYEAETGRFTNQDPIGLVGGENLYFFAPNAQSWLDPWGLSCGPLLPRLFRRWRRGEAIDKPLPDGRMPSWDVVRSRYWKNRHLKAQGTGEFSSANMKRMKRGKAPLDSNGNPMELHHHVPQRLGRPDRHSPFNLREVTREQHAALDPYRNLGAP
ncbi:Cell wall-associated polypeptide CWBP200 [Neisseria zoodegmatis]|uniref:Cell wall-associated polypeptide CWBP200 n=1 Tax=Neisseria zoodegmatis TaxID=326523 RepID=A0A378WF92_9NEIS|nr:DUF6531 domain-containing protein [Neisseria zoodegmatis]SUA35712.1 Cell wall-associated polypeptide CWBP200 [Neisseria zoodegmatis]